MARLSLVFYDYKERLFRKMLWARKDFCSGAEEYHRTLNCTHTNIEATPQMLCAYIWVPFAQQLRGGEKKKCTLCPR